MDFINDADHFDQHFLKDDKVIHAFVDAGNFTNSDTVVEIGPGKGIISNLIAKKVSSLYCIEYDKRLKPFLDKLCNSNKNVEIIYDNALDVDIPLCNKIITALPYSIIEPFMKKMVRTQFEELIMIMGSRFVNSVENKEITYLSLLTNSFFEMEKIMDISPDCFEPKPRTMSSMIRIRHKQEDSNKIYNIFREMFLLDHKKIKNCLIESLIINECCSTQKEAREIIKQMNISEDILETKLEVCSNDKLKELYTKIELIVNRK